MSKEIVIHKDLEKEIKEIVIHKDLEQTKDKEIVIRKDFYKENDTKIEHLTQQIDARRNLLLSKQTTLKMAAQQNQFLNMVREDYAKYYNVIAQQKQEQLDALTTLDKYVKDLKHSEDISDAHIDEIAKDQMRIIKEMRSIRQNINSLIL